MRIPTTGGKQQEKKKICTKLILICVSMCVGGGEKELSGNAFPIETNGNDNQTD